VAALDPLVRDRMMNFQELADAAVRDLIEKHGRANNAGFSPGSLRGGKK
jgi:hypothetical protein